MAGRVTADAPRVSGESGAPGAGTITGYRGCVYALVRDALRATGPIAHAVDVGAGEGWYARQLVRDGVVRLCTAVEIKRRSVTYVEPVLYDGRRLPLPDRSCELVYAIDVVHHAPEPVALLDEMARVSARFILLKDHTHRGIAGRVALTILDEIGNRRFGIPSPGAYQRDWSWLPALQSRGFVPRTMIHPAPCHAGVLGALTNRLQFVAIFERTHAD